VSVFSALCIFVGMGVYSLSSALGPVRDAFFVYVRNILWCLPTLFIFFVLQRYWQARQRVLPFTVIILGANVLNLVACLAFGLGLWGFPRLEVKGIAAATVICRYLMLVAAIAYTWQALKPPGYRMPGIDWSIQRQLFRLGFPAAGHTALEIGAFTIATFVAGALGSVPLAAHHVCLMMAAFTFMFPLGFSAAAAVRVGTFIGSGEPHRARVAGWICIGLSVGVMTCFAAGYVVLPRALLGLFTSDTAVVELGVKILMLVACFQVADGIQVSTTGALRGLGNTRSAMIANLVGHYPIGLALGLVLCFPLKLGAVGIWAGLAAGLVSVAVMLIRKWNHSTRDVSQLRRIDAPDVAAVPW
jgi:MATE family multidrug resistance protein